MTSSKGLAFVLLAVMVSACTEKQAPKPAGPIEVGFISEPCERKGLGDQPSKYVECLFYNGTGAFRQKDYGFAFRNWRALAELPPLPADLEHHRTNAWNNLGYLYYKGWGVSEDRAEAVDYWKRAYDRGHDEAAYHLCHSYADRDRPQYDRALARGYCNEALRRYEALKDEDKEILSQLRNYLAKLED